MSSSADRTPSLQKCTQTIQSLPQRQDLPACRPFRVSLSSKASSVLLASFEASSHSWPKLNLSLQSIPSVNRSLPCPCTAMSPLISAPIPPLNSALVVRFRSIITSISFSCSQSLAVAHVLSRLQLLSVLGPVPTHTHSNTAARSLT